MRIFSNCCVCRRGQQPEGSEIELGNPRPRVRYCREDKGCCSGRAWGVGLGGAALLAGPIAFLYSIADADYSLLLQFLAYGSVICIAVGIYMLLFSVFMFAGTCPDGPSYEGC